MYKEPKCDILWEIRNNDRLVSSEVRLWRMVITQAFIDASIKSVKKQKYRTAKKQSLIWLLNDQKDFRLVCMLAEMCPQKVRKLAYSKFDLSNKTISL